MSLTKHIGLILSVVLFASCAIDNTPLDIAELKSLNELSENDKKILGELRNSSVNNIYVDGIGEIKIGTILIHKSDGEGTVKALYLRKGTPWALFFLKGSSVGTISYLNKEYFYELNE